MEVIPFSCNLLEAPLRHPKWVEAALGKVLGDSRVTLQLEKLVEFHEATGLHSLRVAVLATDLAFSLHLDLVEVLRVAESSCLHDVGKQQVPRSILEKPGRLTETERAIVKLHPWYGYQMVDACDEVRRDIAGHHEHQRRGYRRVQVGPFIGVDRRVRPDAVQPLREMILALADSYDALINQRPYKPALSLSEVMEVLTNDYRGLPDILSILLNQVALIHPPVP